MKIFTDNHHGDLYYSLHLLFEKRLRWELFRPIGYDWFHQGFWKIGNPYPNPLDTARQYLDINNNGWDQYKNLNGSHYIEDDIYHVYVPTHDYYERAITLEKFKSTRFDIILPTFPGHDRPYSTLRDKFQPQAKMVAQLGNTNQGTFLKNVIHSVPYIPQPGQNTVHCHQELDPHLYSHACPNSDTKNIFSMVNCLPYAGKYQQYKKALVDIQMRAYGAASPDGPLYGAKGVGEKMKEANIGWHLKPLGGLGHTAMGWFASGRPVVTNMSQNISWGGDAVRLFEPGVTCLDIETHSFEENCKLIHRMLEPEENLQWSERARQRFDEVFNYDEEEAKVRAFLERLL